MTKKKNIEKERIDKLEKCVRDKDIRISKLEQRFINIKNGIIGALLILSISGVGSVLFLISERWSDLYGKGLKTAGVVSIAFVATYCAIQIINFIVNMGKDADKKEVIYDDSTLLFLLCAVVTVIVFAVYVFSTYPNP